MKHKNKQNINKEFIFGINPIFEVMRARQRKLFRVIVKDGAKHGKKLRQILNQAESRRTPISNASIDDIAKLAGSDGHHGVVAQVSTPNFISLEKLLDKLAGNSSPTLAILDGIMDPRNLGAILRSALAFGIDGVILPTRRSAGYTPVALKASAGAGEYMRLCKVTNIAETVRLLRDRGFSCLAFDSGADHVFDRAPEGSLALVLGGEGVGARPLVMKRCGGTVRIPMKGLVGSLNVSSAASIIFYTAAQRL